MEKDTDFYNKLATEIGSTFFPSVVYYRDNEDYTQARYAIELFNNGCLTYRVLVNRLTKHCGSDKTTIKNIIDKYIIQ